MISVINLENNNIGDKAAILLIQGLNQSSYLKKLNLSKNKLTDKVKNFLKSLFLFMNPRFAII